MLRFFVNERQDDWTEYLREPEFIINNSANSSTKQSPNQILYGFKLRDTITAFGQQLAGNSSDPF
jgi:hypothetical protein